MESRPRPHTQRLLPLFLATSKVQSARTLPPPESLQPRAPAIAIRAQRIETGRLLSGPAIPPPHAGARSSSWFPNTLGRKGLTRQSSRGRRCSGSPPIGFSTSRAPSGGGKSPKMETAMAAALLDRGGTKQALFFFRAVAAAGPAAARRRFGAAINSVGSNFVADFQSRSRS